MSEYDPNTEVGPEVAPGMRIVDERTGVEIRGLYDGVAVWLYADGRIVNAFANTDWAGSRRHYATDQWIHEHGRAALASVYPEAPVPEGLA